MSVCVPPPNFGCLIRHCALFRQNASGVYASGPGPWEVSPASSGTLRIVTPLHNTCRTFLASLILTGKFSRIARVLSHPGLASPTIHSLAYGPPLIHPISDTFYPFSMDFHQHFTNMSIFAHTCAYLVTTTHHCPFGRFFS